MLNESKAFAYVLSKKWSHRLTSSNQINCQTCPLCKDNNWHFFISATGDKDGVSHCVKCGESTNLYKLRRFLNDSSDFVLESPQAVAVASAKQDPLPDYEALHKALVAEAEDESVEYSALDYMLDRGFNMETIESMKLGLTEMFGKKWIAYPYFGGPSGYTFVKYRTLPPAEKDFHGPSGRPAGLYNEKALIKNLPYLLIIESEGGCVTALSKGFQHTVGVPGAAMKKADWIDTISSMKPEKIFICYDNDKAGVKGAKELNSRLGLENCYNIVIPEVEWTDEVGEVRRTKDFGEWFQHGGGTPELFQQLMDEAKPFPVEGVWSTSEVIRELREEIEGRGSLAPKYDFAWPSLNRVAGGREDGDVVGWIAEGKVGKSTLVLNQIDYSVRKYEEPGLMICLEMMPKRLVRKWISSVTETPDSPQVPLTAKAIDDGLIIAGNYKADLLFGYTKHRKFEPVAEMFYQAKRRFGIKFAAFDNLQMLVQRLEFAQQETSNITKNFKSLCLELGIILDLIVQPHRVKDGEIVSARNSAGSSAIEKDVDMMLAAHRNREGKITAKDFDAMGQLETDTNFSPPLLLRADLTRYSAGGATTLWLQGDLSKVYEFEEGRARFGRGMAPQSSVIQEDYGIAA